MCHPIGQIKYESLRALPFLDWGNKIEIEFVPKQCASISSVSVM